MIRHPITIFTVAAILSALLTRFALADQSGGQGGSAQAGALAISGSHLHSSHQQVRTTDGKP